MNLQKTFEQLSAEAASCDTIRELFGLWRQAQIQDPNFQFNSEHMGIDRIPKESFLFDGECGEYRKSDPKVLFILKEGDIKGKKDKTAPEEARGYGWSEEEGRHRHWFADGPRVSKYRKALGEIASIISDGALNADNAAFMNLNKRGGYGAVACPNALDQYVSDYRVFIRRQIELLHPDWIVCCGTMGYVRKVLGIDPECGGKEVPSAFAWGGYHFLSIYHPASRGRYRNRLEKIREVVERYRVSRKVH